MIKIICLLAVFLFGGTQAYSANKETPLFVATKKGDIETVKKLIKEGADVNAKTDRENFTVLHAAVRSGKFDIVKILIDNGADVNAISGQCHGLSTFDVAFYGKNRNIDIIELLIDRGVDINGNVGRDGATYLHLAAKKGDKELVELLIQRGADLYAVDNDGLKPEDYAETVEIANIIIYEKRNPLFLNMIYGVVFILLMLGTIIYVLRKKKQNKQGMADVD